MLRKEHDLLGEKMINCDSYYGIHTQRAIDNFPITNTYIHPELVRAMVIIKKAAAITNLDLGFLDKTIGNAIITACDEILAGKLQDQFIVDPLQGGAGTSINMNINEVIANRAIELLGGKKSDYSIVHPLDHVNMSQSTNDVFPTAVRIAAIRMISRVSELFADLQSSLQDKEEEFKDVIKVGRTQLQDAVPIMLGQEFGAWAQAIARDRWRIYKVEERLRQINIGGTAIGTGINADRKYIYMITEKLRKLTGLGLARAEFLVDPTQNNDVFVEVSGLLKTAACNLSKIASDLRLLSSGPRAGFGEIILPSVQAGSSIMPGKVNPVIPEAINQIAFKVIGNDVAISLAVQSGQLELNAFLPLISQSLFETLDLLENGVKIFIEKCIKGIKANEERCKFFVENSFTLITALINRLGYEKATEIAKLSCDLNKNVRQILIEQNILDISEIDEILDPIKMTTPRKC